MGPASPTRAVREGFPEEGQPSQDQNGGGQVSVCHSGEGGGTGLAGVGSVRAHAQKSPGCLVLSVQGVVENEGLGT